jgi:hypothetical protein
MLTVADTTYIGYTIEVEPALWFTCNKCTTTILVTGKHTMFEKLRNILVKEGD